MKDRQSKPCLKRSGTGHAAKFAFESGTRMYERQSAAATRMDAFATNGDVAWTTADPPVVVNETEVVDAISDPEFDVIHAWRLRDRSIIRKVEDYLAREMQDIWVKV